MAAASDASPVENVRLHSAMPMVEEGAMSWHEAVMASRSEQGAAGAAVVVYSAADPAVV